MGRYWDINEETPQSLIENAEQVMAGGSFSILRQKQQKNQSVKKIALQDDIQTLINEFHQDSTKENKRGENSTAKGDAAPRPATPTKPVRLNSAARTRIIKTNADSGKAPVASLTMKP